MRRLIWRAYLANFLRRPVFPELAFERAVRPIPADLKISLESVYHCWSLSSLFTLDIVNSPCLSYLKGVAIMTAGNGNRTNAGRSRGGRIERRRQADDFREVNSGSFIRNLFGRERNSPADVEREHQVVKGEVQLAEGAIVAPEVMPDERQMPLTLEALEVFAWKQVYGAARSYPAALSIIKQCKKDPKLAEKHDGLLFWARMVVDAVESERKELEAIQEAERQRRQAMLRIMTGPVSLLFAKALPSWRYLRTATSAAAPVRAAMSFLRRVCTTRLRAIGVMRIDPAFADAVRSAEPAKPDVTGPVDAAAPANTDVEVVLSAPSAAVSPAAAVGAPVDRGDAPAAVKVAAPVGEQLEFQELADKRPHGKKARTLRRIEKRLGREQRAAG